jgi:hypothetical protein
VAYIVIDYKEENIIKLMDSAQKKGIVQQIIPLKHWLRILGKTSKESSLS